MIEDEGPFMTLRSSKRKFPTPPPSIGPLQPMPFLAAGTPEFLAARSRGVRSTRQTLEAACKGSRSQGLQFPHYTHGTREYETRKRYRPTSRPIGRVSRPRPRRVHVSTTASRPRAGPPVRSLGDRCALTRAPDRGRARTGVWARRLHARRWAKVVAKESGRQAAPSRLGELGPKASAVRPQRKRFGLRRLGVRPVVSSL
jgi:hypothetical protein